MKALPGSATIQEYIVATEDHADGGKHIHAFIKYSTKIEFTPSRFDILGYHGNYQKASSWKAVQDYCKKDGNYISNIDIESAKRKKSCGRELNKRIIEEDLIDLVDDGTINIWNLKTYHENKLLYQALKTPVLPRAVHNIPNKLNQLLIVFPSKHKQRNYWIWSARPNTGKTTFLRFVSESYPSFWYSYAEKFQSLSNHCQFVLLDEYSVPHLTATQINQMCDGTFKYPVKGGAAVVLNDSILLVASNKSIEQVYPNACDLIKARFHEITL